MQMMISSFLSVACYDHLEEASRLPQWLVEVHLVISLLAVYGSRWAALQPALSWDFSPPCE